MKPFLLILLLALCTGPISFGQNLLLTQQINAMADQDQHWRQTLRLVMNRQADSIRMDSVQKMIKITDSLNLTEIRKIFRLHGYPGISMVGSEGSHNFWLLVQHADRYPAFQDSVLQKMKTEAEKGNALMIDYVYLLDRVRVNTKQLQVYGTQMKLNADGTSYEPQPVEDPGNLNERRKGVKLEPIEEYIKAMNERYAGTLKPKITINPPSEYGK